MKRRIVALAGVTAAATALGTGAALAALDEGQQHEQWLASHSVQSFGVGKPLAASSSQQISESTARANPTALVTLAQGLTAHVVTANVAAPNIDMMAFWPGDAHPQWIIACNEEGPDEPGLQRINLETGDATTILTGTDACDPVRRTAWGTIVFGEEAGGGPDGGALYELLDPVATTGVTLDRSTGLVTGGTGADGVVRRDALGRLSYEGIGILPSGVVYYGDENRPATGAPGGAYYKFVPSELRGDSAGPITDLDDSPLAAGSVYGLRIGARSGGTDYGHGTSYGRGSWVPVPSLDLQAEAAALHLSGYYRPEDLELDRAVLAGGSVRFCSNNTGNEGTGYYGEMVCITDGTVVAANANTAVPEAQPLVIGSPYLAMPDNIGYQPGRGNWIIHEDADTEVGGPDNNDLWSCLDDGADSDLQSDGCVRVGTLNDLDAEWTGGFFTPDGKTFIVSVQHNVSGNGTVLAITGWK